MGYHSNFNICILRGRTCSETIPDGKQIFREIEDKSGYRFNSLNNTDAELYDASWNNAVNDITSVAKKHPDVILELTVYGDDRDDMWSMRFCGEEQETSKADIVWPEYTEILTKEEAAPKARYQRFQNALKNWLVFKESLRKDIIKRLEESPIDLTEFDFGKHPYFFISAGEKLYCHQAILCDNGKIDILAGLTDDPEDVSFALSDDDMMQDTITLNDFMDCIYGNKNNCLDD